MSPVLCEINPCLNEGICYGQDDDFICECTEYWTGEMCEGKKAATEYCPLPKKKTQ